MRGDIGYRAGPGCRFFAALLALAASLSLVGCRTTLRLEDRPISFSAARQSDTLSYIEQHYGLRPDNISIAPKIIVLHWTAIDDLDKSFAAFDPERLPETRPDLADAGQVNVSAQFLVHRKGTVYRLMPETWMARHVIGLNFSAIGVENVGGGQSRDNMTRAQIRANIQLVRYLVEKYPSIEYLIGHMEYQRFEGHPLWLEMDESYRTDKVDPGERFMSAVRAAVADLGLKGLAEIRDEIDGV